LSSTNSFKPNDEEHEDREEKPDSHVGVETGTSFKLLMLFMVIASSP
jgi:hypothetical protein